jgi:methylmalonyl-CoA/ethylmalonyl-CoA epimerase
MHVSIETAGARPSGGRGCQADLGRRLHHVGIVVRSIHADIDGFAASIGASSDTKIFHDPLQKVRVAFLQTAEAGGPQIELVEPAADDSPVSHCLKAGGGLHHLCYEVDNLDTCLREMRKTGAIVVKPPLPAVAFDNRRIAWVVTRQKLLLEFLERAGNGEDV